jgi:phosphoglucomutase
LRFGLYEESLKSVTKKGKDGAAAIKAMMDRLRSTPPTALAGSKVIRIKDFENGVEHDLISGSRATIDLPRSNVLQFFTEDGYKITARPSGTEPKIKFYISLRSEVGNTEELRERKVELKKLNEQLIAEISS